MKVNLANHKILQQTLEVKRQLYYYISTDTTSHTPEFTDRYPPRTIFPGHYYSLVIPIFTYLFSSS